MAVLKKANNINSSECLLSLRNVDTGEDKIISEKGEICNFKQDDIIHREVCWNKEGEWYK